MYEFSRPLLYFFMEKIFKYIIEGQSGLEIYTTSEGAERPEKVLLGPFKSSEEARRGLVQLGMQRLAEKKLKNSLPKIKLDEKKKIIKNKKFHRKTYKRP